MDWAVYYELYVYVCTCHNVHVCVLVDVYLRE